MESTTFISPANLKWDYQLNFMGRKLSFLRVEGRNWYPDKNLGLRNCIDAVVFYSATARVSPCSLPVLDRYMQT